MQPMNTSCMVKDCNNINLIDLKTEVTETDCADILKTFPMTTTHYSSDYFIFVYYVHIRTMFEERVGFRGKGQF